MQIILMTLKAELIGQIKVKQKITTFLWYCVHYILQCKLYRYSKISHDHSLDGCAAEKNKF